MKGRLLQTLSILKKRQSIGHRPKLLSKKWVTAKTGKRNARRQTTNNALTHLLTTTGPSFHHELHTGQPTEPPPDGGHRQGRAQRAVGVQAQGRQGRGRGNAVRNHQGEEKPSANQWQRFPLFRLTNQRRVFVLVSQ